MPTGAMCVSSWSWSCQTHPYYTALREVHCSGKQLLHFLGASAECCWWAGLHYDVACVIQAPNDMMLPVVVDQMVGVHVATPPLR